jgi:hypothetical protein
MGLPCGISAFLLMKQTRIKGFLMAWFLSVLSFAVTEIKISRLETVNMFYHKVVGDETKM